MTDIQIETQVKAIKNATKEAAKSKESALRFLTEAGIIKADKKDAKAKK